jgi:hypothetical protein
MFIGTSEKCSSLAAKSLDGEGLSYFCPMTLERVNYINPVYLSIVGGRRMVFFIEAIMYLVLASYLFLVFISWYNFRRAKLKIVLFFALGFSTLLVARILYITMGYYDAEVYITLLEFVAAVYFVAGMLSV